MSLSPMRVARGARLATTRRAAHWAIRLYQVSVSGLIGRQCRHLPTCSDYADEAIARHGIWAGGWMGAARVCRCHPWGTAGLDPVPDAFPDGVRWYAPWRYGLWRRRSIDHGGWS